MGAASSQLTLLEGRRSVLEKAEATISIALKAKSALRNQELR